MNLSTNSVTAVEQKLRDHLNRQALGLPLYDSGVQEVVDSITSSSKSGFVRGNLTDSINSITAAVSELCHDIRLHSNYDRSHSKLSPLDVGTSPSTTSGRYTSSKSPAKLSRSHSMRSPGSMKFPLSPQHTPSPGLSEDATAKLTQQLQQQTVLLENVRKLHDQLVADLKSLEGENADLERKVGSTYHNAQGSL